MIHLSLVSIVFSSLRCLVLVNIFVWYQIVAMFVSYPGRQIKLTQRTSLFHEAVSPKRYAARERREHRQRPCF